jgi:hypothetical protein
VSQPDFYAILGVPSNASTRDITTAYRKLAMRYHPDRHPDDPNAEERLKDINVAYDTLFDPKLRAAYDQRGRGDAATSADASHNPSLPQSQARHQARHDDGPRHSASDAVGAEWRFRTGIHFGYVLVFFVILAKCQFFPSTPSPSAPGIQINRLAQTPLCSSSSAREALLGLERKFLMQQKTDAAAMLAAKDVSSLSFRYKSEVGYDKEAGSRGCIADLTVNGEAGDQEVGYVIEPNSNRTDFDVRLLSVEFVRARYAAGILNKKLGAPVGREAMRVAIIAALKEFDDQMMRRRPTSMSKAGNVINMADGVGAVLPTADCRALDAGSYSCPLQVEFNDKFMAMLGQQPFRLLNEEFVFNKTGDGWQVTEESGKAFAFKIVRERNNGSDRFFGIKRDQPW